MSIFENKYVLPVVHTPPYPQKEMPLPSPPHNGHFSTVATYLSLVGGCGVVMCFFFSNFDSLLQGISIFTLSLLGYYVYSSIIKRRVWFRRGQKINSEYLHS